MNRVSKNQKGFSTIELILIIAVVSMIGVVGYLVYKNNHQTVSQSQLRAITLPDIQRNARNNQRYIDIDHDRFLLKFVFQFYGYYPSRADLNNPTWISNFNMNVSSSSPIFSLADPSNNTVKTLVSTPEAYAYAYVPLNAAGNSCESNDTTCVSYTLTATYEGLYNDSSSYTVKNQN